MLHKSFKPAKCKTSLKLATSRIKLMRNKKGVQITQMKRDLAQLLETGQDRTARIRVEHVIREEKMIAAYDLVEIYCELIVARMPIIESQKTCPIDLKEAVTSVIFAAPRCSDISELADIKKQLTAKYGKEFVSAALELRPESGVSRMLVEKLSAVAPDVQTKVKVLTDVAKEHNINWEPTSFEEKESKPPNDLLNGPPVNFQNASMANPEPPKIQSQTSNVNVVHSHEIKRDPPVDFSEQNRKFVADNGIGTSSSSGMNSERMGTRGEGQNWNMGFKDATSAAEAAAESAERAAVAARAAAQFASQEKIERHESPRVSSPSVSMGQGHFSNLHESSSGDRKSKIINQQKHQSEHERRDSERFHEANRRSSNVSSHKEPKIINQKMDQSEHERKDSERFHEGNSRSSNFSSFKESRSELDSGKKESFSGDSKFKTTNQQRDRNQDKQKDNESYYEANNRKAHISTFFVESESEKEGFESHVNLFTGETSRKSPSVHSISSDDEVVFDEKENSKKSVVGNPFAVINEQNIFSESSRTKSDVDDPREDEAVFDDDDGPKFDTGFEYDEVNLESSHVWSPRRNESFKIEETSSRSHIFLESQSFGQHSAKSSEEIDDRPPMSFDHSDGPDSESESEFDNNKKFSSIPEPSRKSRIELTDLVEGELSHYNDEEKKQPSRQSSNISLGKYETKKHELDQKSYDTFEDNKDFINQSNDSDSGSELKFGTLTGGLRNKGGVLKYPSYKKTTSTDTSNLSKKFVKESSIKKPIVSVQSSESDSDDYNDKFPVLSSKNTRSQFSPPVTFFDDDDDVTTSEKEVSNSKQASSSSRLRTELSRRTRGAPSVSSSRTRVDPEGKTVISTSTYDRKPTWKDEVPAQPRYNARKTEESGRIEVQQKPKVNNSVNIKQEGLRKSGELGKKEAVKKVNLGSEKMDVENVVKKPSYVHPKLPDYDTFAAKLQSLRDEHK